MRVPGVPGSASPTSAPLVLIPTAEGGGGSSATYGTAGRETGKSHHTSPILKGQVREPPDIAQPHCITHHGEDEIQLARPVPSGFIFIPYIVFLNGGKGGKKEKKKKIGQELRLQTSIAEPHQGHPPLQPHLPEKLGFSVVPPSSGCSRGKENVCCSPGMGGL